MSLRSNVNDEIENIFFLSLLSRKRRCWPRRCGNVPAGDERLSEIHEGFTVTLLARHRRNASRSTRTGSYLHREIARSGG